MADDFLKMFICEQEEQERLRQENLAVKKEVTHILLVLEIT